MPAETANGSRPAAPLPDAFEPIAQLSRAETYEVWDAWDRSRGCRVVVKAVRPDRRGERGAAARLLAEGELLGRLSHPHIVRALETLPAPPLVVMESLGGATLAQIVDEEEPLSAVEIAHLGLQLTSAVAYLHAQGRLHLDLKPSNVIAEAGRARLIDLGLASPPGRVPPELGTWCYLAPEQVGGERVGPAADAWGLGALLFECACGFPPFDDPAHPEDRGGGYPQLERGARRVSAVRELGAGLDQLVAACLSPEPAERPGLAELAAGLEEIAELPADERRLSRTLATEPGAVP